MNLVERRAFPRQPVDHETELTLPNGTALPARIVEASARGIRVELDRPLATDTPVRVIIEKQVVLGRVCYCAEGAGGYYLGLYLEQTLAGLDDLAKLSRVLEDDQPQPLSAH